MKILLVSVFKESVIGGVSVHSTNLRDRLLVEGHDVATVDFYGALDPSSSRVSKGGALTAAAVQILRHRVAGYRLVHFHASNKAPLYYLTAGALKAMRSKVLLSIHSGLGYDNWLAGHPAFDRANRLAFRLLDRLIFMNIEETVSIARRYPTIAPRIRKVNPFIAPAVEARHRVPTPAQLPFRVATVGAFIPRYCTEETLAACRVLAEDHGIAVELTMIESSAYAQDAYRERLAEVVDEARGDRLKVTMVVDTHDVLAALAGHHAFVRPARGDSYGLCVAEALLLGIPSIATDVCTRCAAADLYAPGDVDALVAWLLTRSQSLATAGHSLLTNEEDSYQDYIDIYRQVLGK